jgi:hypothetical protein
MARRHADWGFEFKPYATMPRKTLLRQGCANLKGKYVHSPASRPPSRCGSSSGKHPNIRTSHPLAPALECSDVRLVGPPAFVRTRGVTTALIESYRDEEGRPLLANLHGEPDTLSALAKLAARRKALRTELDALRRDEIDANQFYNVFTGKVLAGHQYSAAERKEIDRLLRQRERLLARITEIEATLAVIEKDGAVIKKHCDASAAEVQAAVHRFQKKFDDAEALSLGLEYALREQHRKAKAKLRRLST